MKRIQILQAVLLLVFCRFLCLYACINPIDESSSGVLLNNGEKLYIDRLKNMGNEGYNYFQNCTSEIPSAVAAKGIQILSPTIEPSGISDPVSIKNVKPIGNYFVIDVSYDGGKAAHQFYLAIDSIAKITDTVNFILYHNANNDSGKTVINEKLIFNIDAFDSAYGQYAPFTIIINGKNPVVWYPDNNCKVKYRSHAYDEVMVYISFGPEDFDSIQKFPAMRIVTDPQIEFTMRFDYESVIVAELRWLIENNILEGISDLTIQKIQKSKANGLYWTHQDSLINFNAVFTLRKNENNNAWIWGGVEYTQRNGCSENIEYKLPPGRLEKTPTVVRKIQKETMINKLKITRTGSGILLNIPQTSASGYKLEIIDLNGKLLKREHIPSHKKSFLIQKKEVSKGIYRIVLWNGKLNASSNIIMQ